MGRTYHAWEKREMYTKPLGRHRHRWEDNIKMHLREIGYEGMD
jgi:hypothetical protein